MKYTRFSIARNFLLGVTALSSLSFSSAWGIQHPTCQVHLSDLAPVIKEYKNARFAGMSFILPLLVEGNPTQIIEEVLRSKGYRPIRFDKQYVDELTRYNYELQTQYNAAQAAGNTPSGEPQYRHITYNLENGDLFLLLAPTWSMSDDHLTEVKISVNLSQVSSAGKGNELKTLFENEIVKKAKNHDSSKFLKFFHHREDKDLHFKQVLIEALEKLPDCEATSKDLPKESPPTQPLFEDLAQFYNEENAIDLSIEMQCSSMRVGHTYTTEPFTLSTKGKKSTQMATTSGLDRSYTQISLERAGNLVALESDGKSYRNKTAEQFTFTLSFMRDVLYESQLPLVDHRKLPRIEGYPSNTLTLTVYPNGRLEAYYFDPFQRKRVTTLPEIFATRYSTENNRGNITDACLFLSVKVEPVQKKQGALSPAAREEEQLVSSEKTAAPEIVKESKAVGEEVVKEQEEK